MGENTMDKFFVTLDKDGDREGPLHHNKAQAIEWARTRLDNFYGKAAYVAEVVSVIKPSTPPVQVVDV